MATDSETATIIKRLRKIERKTEQTILNALEGTPIFDEYGKPMLDADGKPMMAPPTAAVMREAQRWHAYLHAEAQAQGHRPQYNDGPVGNILKAMHERGIKMPTLRADGSIPPIDWANERERFAG